MHDNYSENGFLEVYDLFLILIDICGLPGWIGLPMGLAYEKSVRYCISTIGLNKSSNNVADISKMINCRLEAVADNTFTCTEVGYKMCILNSLLAVKRLLSIVYSQTEPPIHHYWQLISYCKTTNILSNMRVKSLKYLFILVDIMC